MDDDTQKQAAYHEAGHAIASLVYGHRFRFVTIRAGGDEDDGAPHGFVRGRAKDLAVVQLAGIAAAADLSGRNPWDDAARSGEDREDLAAAGRFVDNWVVFLNRAYGEAAYRDLIWGEALEAARQLVEQNREPIRILAEALLDQETLSYDEVIRILNLRCPGFGRQKKEGC